MLLPSGSAATLTLLKISSQLTSPTLPPPARVRANGEAIATAIGNLTLCETTAAAAAAAAKVKSLLRLLRQKTETDRDGSSRARRSFVLGDNLSFFPSLKSD